MENAPPLTVSGDRVMLRRCTLALSAVFLFASCGGDDEQVAPAPAVPSAITVSPETATLQSLGETRRLSANVRDQNGLVMSGVSVAWATGDATVATVSGTGLVAAVSNGTVRVTASVGTVSGSADVVVEQRVAQVSVSPAAHTLPALEDTVRMSAAAADANGHGVAGTTFTWGSNNSLIVTVDAAGLAQAVGPGSATLTAAAGSVSGSAEVTIPGPAPFDPTPPPSDPTPMLPDTVGCAGWEEWFVGEYSWFNNVWNRQNTTDYEQCIMRRTLPQGTVEYGWRWRWPLRENEVKAYPEVIYGHKPWHEIPTTLALPRRIGDIEALTVDYEAYLTAEGVYNFAFDFWITRNNPPSESGISHEIMIWLDYGFRPAPPEYYVGPVRVDGVLWDLYVWPDRVWHTPEETTFVADFIAFLRHEDQYVGSIDLIKLFDYLVDRGHLEAHHYLTAIELGNEATSGTGELWFKRFEVNHR